MSRIGRMIHDLFCPGRCAPQAQPPGPPPPPPEPPASAEKMKFYSLESKRVASVESHAHANAVSQIQNISMELMKSSDALAELARGMQRRS